MPVRARLAFLRDYRAPYRDAARRVGRWRAAPVTWSFLALTLLISLLWRLEAGHQVAAVCCAYRATDLTSWQRAARVAGSAFLVRRPVEAAWSVAACWLLLAPLEAMVGTRRMLLVGMVGNLVPTVSMALATGVATAVALRRLQRRSALSGRFRGDSDGAARKIA